MTFLLSVLYVLNIRWASGTDIDCFAELLPWIFGADDGDTKITAADDIFTPEATSSGWDFHAYLGGQTTDPRLVGETTSGPLSQERAFLMRYRVDRTVDQPVHNGIEYYKYFANTQIAYVDSVRCNYDSNKYMYAFLRSYDGLTSYLLVTNYALITYKQYKIGFSNDGGTTFNNYKFQFTKQNAVVQDNKMFFIVNRDQALNAAIPGDSFYTGLAYFTFNDLKNTGSSYDTQTAAKFFKMDCTDATQAKHCRGHQLSEGTHSTHTIVAGIKTTSDGTGRFQFYAMEVNRYMAQRWAITRDTGLTVASNGNSFNVPSKMCYNSNYLWFTTGSTSAMSYYLYKYQAQSNIQPLSFNIGSSSRVNTPLAVYCKSSEEMYDLRVDDQNKITINHYTIKTDGSVYQYLTAVVSTKNPFSAGTITDAHYVWSYGNTDPLKFMLFGYTSSISSSDFVTSFTNSKTHGFFYSTNTDEFPSCHDNQFTMSASATTLVNTAQVWTIESSNLMTEITGSGKDLLTIQKDSLTHHPASWSHSFTNKKTLDGAMTDTRWCSYFEKYAPAFIDRTVDLTLNALIGADYPDIVIDRFVNETHETGSHPFKIEENFGPSSDLKCTDTDFIWTYSWTTTMSGSGTPLVDTYPVVSRKESYGNAQKIRFDFTDAAETYVGNMTIALTASLPFSRGSQTITFNVETLSYCHTTANKISITCPTTQIDQYISSSKGDSTITCTTNSSSMSTLTTTTCPYATILYDIEISSDKVTSVLHSADTHAMSTLKVIVQQWTNTSPNLQLSTDQVSDTSLPTIYDDLNNIRGLYYIRVITRNEHEDRWDSYSTSPWIPVLLEGCKLVYPQTYTALSGSTLAGTTNSYWPLPSQYTMTFQIFQPSDQELKHGHWEYNVGPEWSSSSTTCANSYCSFQYLSSEDGSTNHAELDHSSRIKCWPINISTDRSIIVVTTGFANNKHAGQYHLFNYNERIWGSGLNFFYQPTQQLKLQILKNCGYSGNFYSKTTNIAQYNSLTSAIQIYKVTDNKDSKNFDQFSSVDIWCTQTLSTSVVKSDGTIITGATWLNFMTFTFETDQEDSSKKHLLEIQTEDEQYHGNYTVTVLSQVLDREGTDSDSFVFNLWMQHWCWNMQFDKSPQATPINYFIYDVVHGEVVAMKQQQINKNLGYVQPQFKSLSLGTSKSTSLIQTECGSLAYDTSVIKNSGTTSEAIDTSVYTFDLTDNSNLFVDITTDNKTYIQPNSTSNWTMTEQVTVKAYNSLYSWVYTTVSFDITFKDPCLSLFYLQDPKDDLVNNQTIILIPNYPTVNFTVQRFTPYVIDDSGSRKANGYCGSFDYKLVYQKDKADYDKKFILYEDRYTEFYLELQTDDNSYNQTVHELQLVATSVNYPDYPKGILNFTADFRYCKVQKLIYPRIDDTSYIFRQGIVTHQSQSPFIQWPDCEYEYEVTSYWKNGTLLDPIDIKFSYDKLTQIIQYEFNFQDKNQAGMHEVVVQYKFVNHRDLQIDKHTTWKINLIFRPILTPHEAPLFLGDKLPSLILLDIFRLNEYEFETGPASEDTISATFSVAADSKVWLDFITVDIDPDTYNMKFKIFPTLSAHIGTYELRLMLIDNASDRKSGLTEYETALPKTTVFKVPVQVYNSDYSDFGDLNQGSETENGNNNLGNCTIDCIPQIKFKGISTMGIIMLEFSKDMIVPESIDQMKGQIYINTVKASKREGKSSLFAITISPGLDQDENNLEGTWKVSSFKPRSVEISLNFSRALYVSTGETRDKLTLQILDKQSLVDSQYKLSVEQSKFESTILTMMVPLSDKQGQNLIATAENLGDSLQGAVFSNIAMNIILSGSLQYIWGMINTFQIVFHLPGANIKMPGNSKTVYSALISITQFNFVPEEYVEYFFIWNYFSSDHSTNKRMLQGEAPVEKPSATKALLAMSDIGYEADLTVENLQTLYLLILLYLIMLLIFGVTFALKVYKPEKYTKAFLKLQGKLFWNFLFRFTLESYLEMAICCLINTRFGPWNREASLHEQVSLGYAFILLILLVAFPMYIAYFSIKTPLDRLYNDKSLKGRKGSIYEGLKLKNKIGLPYNIVFCVRRMVFAVILIYLSDYVWLQLQLNYVISTLMIMFIGFQKPWDIQFLNKLELFNEYAIFFLSYHLMCFTDFYQNFEVRYNTLGPSLIYFTFMFIGINTFVILNRIRNQVMARRKKHLSKTRYMQQVEMLKKVARKQAEVNPLQIKRKIAENLQQLQKQQVQKKFMKEIEAKRLESQIKKAEAKEESKESLSSSSVDEEEVQDVIEEERQYEVRSNWQNEVIKSNLSKVQFACNTTKFGGIKKNTFADMVQQRIQRDQINMQISHRKTPSQIIEQELESSTSSDAVGNYVAPKVKQ